jgi:hypothetical protein
MLLGNLKYFVTFVLMNTPELFLLNKYFKTIFPFIIEVSGYDINKNNAININIYVSPTHFCELMDLRVDLKIKQYMLRETSSMIKCLIPDIDVERIKFLFFPDIDSVTIFDGIPEE